MRSADRQVVVRQRLLNTVLRQRLLNTVLRQRLLNKIASVVALIFALPLFKLPAQYKQTSLQTVAVAPTVRVAAGVRVLTHDRNAFSRATRLELVGAPVAVAGGVNVDPAFDLTGVDRVALLSDGRLLTLVPRNSKMLQFAPDGKPEQALGRQGGGPGEFRSLEGLFRTRGDTLFIADRGNSRANWVVATKGVIRQQPMPRFETAGHPEVIGILANGDFVLTTTRIPEDGVPDKVTRSVTSIYSATALTTPRLLAELASVEFVLQNATFRGRSSSSPAALRFSRRPFVQISDSTVITGVGDGYAFAYRNSIGTVLTRVAVETSARAVTQAMRHAELKIALLKFNSPGSERMVDPKESERLVRETPFADSLPPYSNFFMSPNKTLWIVDYIAPTDTEWSATAFRADGAIVGRLTVKGKGTPLAFGDDRVVIRSEDEDGVVSLTVRRIGVSTAKSK